MYSLLPMNEILRGDNTMSSAESKKLMWFGHKIAAPLAGSRSKPSNSNFHARRAKGCTMRRRRD
jgi:hypothetical protein